MNTNLAKLLKGCELLKDNDGNVVVQTIRNMAIAFLTCEPQFSLDDRFENPLKVVASNRHYGHMQLKNNTSKDMIVAPQIAVMTKYAAQNHAMTKSAAIRALQSQDYDDAACVQGSQGGTIKGHGDEDLRFIPIAMRENALEHVGTRSGFSHLYDTVDRLGARTQTGAGHYLDVYYNKRKTELDEFIAHFERPTSHVIGTIVFIDGEIVAIDKFPSYTYTHQVWDLLIRDCYGSLAIESMLQDKQPRRRFTQEMATAPGSGTVIEKLSAVLDRVKSDMSREAHDRLSEVMAVEFEVEPDTSNGDYRSDVLKAEGYIGQVIGSGDYVHMVSLIKKERFDPAVFRKTHAAAEEYRRLAAQQREFSL